MAVPYQGSMSKFGDSIAVVINCVKVDSLSPDRHAALGGAPATG